MAKRRCTGNRAKKAVTIAFPSSSNFWSSSGAQAAGHELHPKNDASVSTQSPSDARKYSYIALSKRAFCTFNVLFSLLFPTA